MAYNTEDPVPFRFQIIKEYPQRGPMHQYRLAKTTSFMCTRCGQSKTSKLVAKIHDRWNFLLCNGCYGWLVSVWRIKAGNLDDVERYSELLELLTRLVTDDEVTRSRVTLEDREFRLTLLSPSALTMLATADAVADGLTLRAATELDWSVAIIALCKAVEFEVVRLITEPLRDQTAGTDLSGDLADRDFSRMARFCKGGRPVELGAIAFFMSAVVRSDRADRSPLATALKSLTRRGPQSDWLFASDGFVERVRQLTQRYRNPAAHTALLNAEDYLSCVEVIRGDDGILWRLLEAVDENN